MIEITSVLMRSPWAKARIRNLITDHRGSGWDTMFWDNERWILVDQASRCDYDAVGGTCSAACPDCTVCTGNNCQLYNASYKLGLVLYAAQIMGLHNERTLEQPLADIEYRLWEGQNENATLTTKSAPTGEATAIAVLAHTVAELTPHTRARWSAEQPRPASHLHPQQNTTQYAPAA